MRTYGTITFRKKADCPSAETLCSYGSARLAVDLKAQVTSHLADCDFCGAELQLLTKHPPSPVVDYKFVGIPSHLRQLAQALLSNRLLRMESFIEAVHDKERLTYTEA